MKRIALILGIVAIAISFASCGKHCRCYRYDGNVDEFSIEELKEKGTSCEMLEEVDYGTKYSLCERVI